MSNKITAVVLVALMLLVVALPANAAITTDKVVIKGAAFDSVAGAPKTLSWDAYNFPAFWYNLDDGQTSETMNYTNIAGSANPSVAIATLPGATMDKNELAYQTMPKFVQYKLDKTENINGTPYTIKNSITNLGNQGYDKIGWFGAEYVALGGDATKLSKLIKEYGTAASDKVTLTTGDAFAVGDWSINVQSVDARASPRKAWMVLSYKGTKVDDIVVDDGDKSTKRVYTYVEKSISGKSDVPMFVTFVDSIFSGSTTDMVQLKYTWAISKDIVVVNSDQQFGSMKVRTASANLLYLDNENTITLNKDSTVEIASGMSFAVANDANNLRFYPFVERTAAGTYELRGAAFDSLAGAPKTLSWNAYNFAAFWYNLDDGQTSENMTYTDIAGSANPSVAIATLPGATMDKNELAYTTIPKFVQYKLDKTENINGTPYTIKNSITNLGNQGYAKIGWLGGEYVALGGDATKLSKLIKEYGTAASDKVTLTTGDAFAVGDWSINVQSVDARASPRKAWMVLSYKGTKVDDIVVDDGDKSTKRVYTYVEKSISGKSDVPMFVTFVDSIFSGSTTDMVQLKYTWAISKDIVVVNSDQQFGSMKVRTASANLLMLDNENTITLNKDSVVDIASGMQFAVANDANNLRFYPKVDYLITGENATTGGTAVTTPIGNITPAGNKTNVTTTPAVVATTTPVRTTTEPTPTPTATKNTPGFEGVFAIAGLLAVAYLVLRQRK